MTRYALSLLLFNLYVGYIIGYAELDIAQVGIKIAGRNMNIHIYEDETIIMAESKELKSLLMRRGDAKTGLKLNIQKTKIMASGPTTSRHMKSKKWKQWQILFSWAPKSLWTLTAATKLKDTCSLEGRKAMENLDSVLKTRESLFYRGL